MKRFRTERVTDERDLETITGWMYGWWGTREGYAREAVLESMRHSLNTDRLPMTFGAYLDGTLIGVYQFTNGDLFVRPDVTPWLANVYLDPAYRNRGFGRRMLATVRENADRYLPGTELHLFTKHAGLYEKFGWVFEAEIDTFLEPRIQRLYRLPASGEPN